MLRQLELAPIPFQIRRLQPPQVVLQLLAREQALLETVPITKGDEAGVVEPKFEPEATLRPFSEIVGQLVALENHRGGLADLPLVELITCVLRPQKRIDCLSVVDLDDVILKLLLGD